MASDKAFEQLKLAALEVKALLIDIDENIQPSVSEIENLNEKVNTLSEQIAIYKYVKSQHELAPNLNLHLKVMEKSADTKEEEIVDKEPHVLEKVVDKESVIAELRSEMGSPPKKMEFSLNDKFRIINELFKQSTTEFNLAMEQLNSFPTEETSTAYLGQLKNLYRWSDDHELTKKIYQLNQKRFQ